MQRFAQSYNDAISLVGGLRAFYKICKGQEIMLAIRGDREQNIATFLENFRLWYNLLMELQLVNVGEKPRIVGSTWAIVSKFCRC